ncbi:DNA-binding protein [Pseudohongiella acticola]|uniref:DNA-binding protein n=1 Tax=Pseudohongiella acticola TaxID=1524254 RepID=A0A1E8CGV9_9GAMM|nr:ATP-binding protein [Pseudohongiella acticola]OFE11666.1 DNA-binding protein [Pseudohongiella acticola]
MNHLPLFLKIIESGILANPAKVASYTRTLAAKLADDGETKAAEKILRAVESANLPKTRTTGQVLSPQSMPVDRDSRFSLADESNPEMSELNIYLEPLIQKSVLEFISFVENAYLLTQAGVGVSPSMLIYGPPGCGKSYLAKYVAARLELPLLTARCDSLISSLLGSTAKNIRSLFEHASNRPCVLFLDEFDALAKARDDQHEVGELKRVVVSLLQNIDSLPSGTILLAATNHEDLLDPAVWRRFAYKMNIQLPSNESREKLIKQSLGHFCSSNVKAITTATDGMSGALIKQACEASVRAALIAGKEAVDDNKLLSKIAEIQYHDLIHAKIPDEEKIKKLKEVNNRLFTTRVLNELLGVSTGKISKILNS